jgi:FkbM family methyltransferase
LKKWKKANIYNNFIGTHTGPEIFNLYVRKSESSLLEPSASYQKNFSSRLRVDSKVEVQSVILKNILKKLQVVPDLIKIDTQGTEFEVISSSKSVFSNSLMVEVEAEFLEMYKGQKLFADVSQELYKTGHQLLYLNRVFGNMNNKIVKTRGQLIFADMLFGLNFERATNLEISRKIKYCILLMNYGHNDFAYQLYAADKDFQDQYPSFATEFKKLEKKKLRQKFRILLITQLDKLTFLYLAIRKTNSLHFDSDRSWPTR